MGRQLHSALPKAGQKVEAGPGWLASWNRGGPKSWRKVRAKPPTLP